MVGSQTERTLGTEIDFFSLRQLEHEFLNESRHVVIRDHLALNVSPKNSAGTSIFMSCLTAVWQESATLPWLPLA